MKFNHTQESGRSMVEMLGVLAIIGVLSVGGIAGYSQAMAKFKVTKAMDQVQTIITNMRTLYASSRKYTAITASDAYKVGILTDETYTGSKGINPFGGEIAFGVGSDARTFLVSYTGLTPEACAKIATAEWGSDESSGLKSITIGGTLSDKGVSGGDTYKWESSGESSKKLPIPVPTAISKCGSTSAGGKIIWEYR